MGILKRLFSSSAPARPGPAGDFMARIPMDTLGQIQDVALSGRKIEAIKMYRQASGCGLKEAKDAVEEIIRRTR